MPEITSRGYRLSADNDERRWRRAEGQVAAAPSDPRPAGRHDRDRIYYSRAFLRLSGVTQVLTPSDEGAPTHNRLTHTIKVAQVARSVAEYILDSRTEQHDVLGDLGGLDVDVVEAAALAHDLGHPPFGHIGEVVLDRYARRHLELPDGFEGNAQSFRILELLEPRSAHLVGIDATAATLCAVLKYPWPRDAESRDPDSAKLPKYGYYDSQAIAFARARASLPDGYPADAQSLEAAIMDIADDITYALHDLEDFRSAGLISLTEVRSELEDWSKLHAPRIRQGLDSSDENNRFGLLRRRLKSASQYDPDLFCDAVQGAGQHLIGLSEATSSHWRVAQNNSRRFISKLITEFIANVEINANPSRECPPIALSAAHWHLVQILKQVTRDLVIGRPDVAALQRGQQRQLFELLKLLHEWLEDQEDDERAPVELRYSWTEYGPRGLLDYVASLTDARAAALHRALQGRGSQTVLLGLAL